MQRLASTPSWYAASMPCTRSRGTCSMSPTKGC
jgi:hypothetical protein